jgi:choline dehydrogenase
VVWEAARPLPRQGATDWAMTIMYRTDQASEIPDVLAHVPLMTFAMHPERLGYRIPEHSLSMTPNVTQPRSRGTVSLASPDPDVPPALDYRMFTDPEGLDEATACRDADGPADRSAAAHGELAQPRGLPWTGRAGRRGT